MEDQISQVPLTAAWEARELRRVGIEPRLDNHRRQRAPVGGPVLARAARDVTAGREANVPRAERVLDHPAQPLDAMRPARQEGMAGEDVEAAIAAHRVELGEPEVE